METEIKQPAAPSHEVDDTIFSTRDLHLAATLMTLRFPLLGTDFQIEGTKSHPIGYFKFEKTPQIEEAKRAFFTSSLMVEPRLFMSNIESLKADVANVRMNPNSRYS